MRKILSLFLAFSLNLQAAPPTGVGSLNSTQINYSNNTIAPYRQATKLAGVNTLIETGNQNMLVNPDFEGLASPVPNGWTCTVGTCTKTTTSGEFTSGKQALKVTLTAQSMNVSQTITTPSGIMKQGYARFTYRIPATGVVTPTITITVDSTLQVIVPSDKLLMDGMFHQIEVPFIFGSTDVKVSYLTGSSTGDVFIDLTGVYQGLGLQNLSLITEWQSYSPVLTGFGTPTGVEFQWRQVAGNYEIRGKFISGTPTGVQAQASLPNSAISASISTIPSIQVTGYGGISVVTASQYIPLIEPSVTYLTFSLQSASSAALSKLTGSQFLSSGQTYSFFASVPIANLAASSQVYSQANSSVSALYTGAPPTGTLGASFNIVTFGTKVLDTHNSYSSGTYTAPVTSTYDISASVAVSGTYNGAQQLNCGIYINGVSKISNVDAPTTGIGRAWVNPNVVAYPLAAGDLVTLRCYNDGTGLSFESNATTNYFSIAKSNSSSIVGSFENVATTPGITKPVLFSAKVTTTSGAVANNKGGVITSCTAANPTVCTFSGLVSEPNCTVSLAAAVTDIAVSSSTSTTSITIGTYSSTTGSADASQPVKIVCHGDK